MFTSAPNFAFELAARRVADKDMAGMDLGDVSHVISGSERVDAATLERFAERFAPSIYGPRRCVRLTVLPRRRCSWRPARSMLRPRLSLRWREVERRCRRAIGRGGPGWSATASARHRLCGSSTRRAGPRSRRPHRRDLGAWRQRGRGYWPSRRRPSRPSAARLVDPSPGTPEGPWLRTGDLGASARASCSSWAASRTW